MSHETTLPKKLAVLCLVVLGATTVAVAQGTRAPAVEDPNLTVTGPGAVGANQNVTATVGFERDREGVRALLRNETTRVAGPLPVGPENPTVDFGAGPEPGNYTVVVTQDGETLASHRVRVSPLAVSVVDVSPGYDAYGEQEDYQLMNATNASVRVRLTNEGDGARTESVVLSVGAVRADTRRVRLRAGHSRTVTLKTDPGDEPGEYPFTLDVDGVTRRGTLTLELTSPATPTPTETERRTRTPTHTDTTTTTDPGTTTTRTGTATRTGTVVRTDTPTATPEPTTGGSMPGFGVLAGTLAILGALFVLRRR